MGIVKVDFNDFEKKASIEGGGVAAFTPVPFHRLGALPQSHSSKSGGRGAWGGRERAGGPGD